MAVALAGHQVVAAAAEALGGEAVAGGGRGLDAQMSLVLAAVRERPVEVGGRVRRLRCRCRRAGALGQQR